VPETPTVRRERRPAILEPLSAGTFLVRLTARRRTVERLRRAQELMSHAVPDGDVDEILYRALDELVQRLEGGGRRPERKRTRQPVTNVDTPPADAERGPARREQRPAREAQTDSRHIPGVIDRAVRARDGHRCTFVGRDGRRCEERRFLEVHHIRPWAAGGPPTLGNLALLCQAHNQYEARRYYGAIAAARVREVEAEQEERSSDLFQTARQAANSFRNEFTRRTAHVDEDSVSATTGGS
jgi:hypothetical protein